MSKRGDKRPRGGPQGGAGADPRGRSQRQLRVGEELRHRLAAAFERGELHDPALADLSITVTEVKVSPDLTNATCYVVPLSRAGGERAQPGDLGAVVRALNHAAGFLRHRVSEELTLRVSPRLSFAPDTSFDEASRVEAILRHPKVAGDVARPAEGGGEPDPEGGDGAA